MRFSTSAITAVEITSANNRMPSNEIVVGGVITGLLAGLFGVGGGSVIVPVLFEVFRVLGVPEEVRMQLCVGASIAITSAAVCP